MNQLSFQFTDDNPTNRRRKKRARPSPGVENRDQIHADLAEYRSNMRVTVLECFRRNPEGLTSKEVAMALGKSLNTVSGRLSELFDAGLIEGVKDQDGKQLKRLACVVWRAVS